MTSGVPDNYLSKTPKTGKEKEISKPPVSKEEKTIDKLFELAKSAQDFKAEDREEKYKTLKAGARKKMQLIQENLREYEKTGRKDQLLNRLQTITELGYGRLKKIIDDQEKKETLFSIFSGRPAQQKPLEQKPPRPPLKRRDATFKLREDQSVEKKVSSPSLLASEGRTKIQSEVLRQVQQMTKFQKDEFRKIALSKMRKVLNKLSNSKNLSSKKALKRTIDFIRDCNPTRNFVGSDMSELSRFEKGGAGQKLWDIPLEKQDEKYIAKRAEVEKKIHGYADEPYKESGFERHRPVYMAVNPKNNPRGAAPYYGNSYFVAKKEVYRKSTFAPQDTFSESFKNRGMIVSTVDGLEIVLAQMDVKDLQALYEMAADIKPHKEPEQGKYIEVQVANVKWSDYEKVVLDRKEVPPESEAEKRWEALSAKHGFKLEFIDSKGWQQDIRGLGLANANKLHQPLPKDKEASSNRSSPSNPTKEQLDLFLDAFSLTFNKDAPNRLSVKKLIDINNKYSDVVDATVKEEEEDKISLGVNNLYHRMLIAAEPFGSIFLSKIKPFALDKKNGERFIAYLENLPDDQQAKEAREEISNLRDTLNKEKKISAGRKKRILKNIEKNSDIIERARLKKRLMKYTSSRFYDLIQVPTQMTGKWVVLINDFSKQLTDPKSTPEEKMKKIVGDARGMFMAHETTMERIKLIEEVLGDTNFKTTNNKLARDISEKVRPLREAAEAFSLALQQFAWSVEADPRGWLKETNNLPDEKD